MNRKHRTVVFAAFMALRTCILFAATDTTPKEIPTPQRILHFPADYSLGTVWIEDETIEHRIETTLVHIDGSEWKYHSPAKGDVIVPTGQRVKLILTGRIWEDPKCSADMKRLGPDDIYTLVLSAAWIPPGKGNKLMDACMPHIAALTGLRELQLDQTRISNTALKSLVNLKNLKILNAPDKLTNGGLGEIAKIKSLKALHIADNQLTDKSILMLQQLPQLEELTLFSSKFTDQSLEYAARLPHLTYLCLCGPFSNAAMAYLQKSTSLKILRIHTPDFNDEGMQHISQIRQLERLNAHQMDKVTDQGISYFAGHKNLKMLDVMHAKLSDASLQVLSNISGLESLVLPNVGFTDDGIEKFSRLKNLESLSVGAASSSPLTDQSMRVIAQLSNLEHLHIGGNGITDDGVAQLAQISRLRELGLFKIHITDRGLQVIGGLKNLKQLSMHPKEPITFKGLNYLNSLSYLKYIQVDRVKKDRHVLNLSGLKSLESLQLVMNSTDDKKLQRPVAVSFLEDEDVKGFGGLDQLNSLMITGVRISDAGFGILAGLKSLQILYLIGPTQITDKGLAMVKADSFLMRLSIDHGHFTAGGLKAFENREEMGTLELTSDTAFDPRAVMEFKKRSTIQALKLQP